MCGIAGIVAADRLHDDEAVARRPDARRHDSSRPRWRRAARRRLRGARAPASQHRRPRGRAPAAVERGRKHLGHLQRRDLQPRAGAAAAGSRRAHVPHAVRHGNARSRLRAVGRRLRAAVPRHVRVRHLGRAAAPPPARARPHGQEAAVLGAACLLTASAASGCSSRRRSRPFSKAAWSRRGRITAAVSELLATRSASGEETLFEGIYKLLPGHRLVYENGRVQISQVPGTFRRTGPTRHWRGCLNASWWSGSGICCARPSACA